MGMIVFYTIPGLVGFQVEENRVVNVKCVMEELLNVKLKFQKILFKL